MAHLQVALLILGICSLVLVQSCLTPPCSSGPPRPCGSGSCHGSGKGHGHGSSHGGSDFTQNAQTQINGDDGSVNNIGIGEIFGSGLNIGSGFMGTNVEDNDISGGDMFGGGHYHGGKPHKHHKHKHHKHPSHPIHPPFPGRKPRPFPGGIPRPRPCACSC